MPERCGSRADDPRTPAAAIRRIHCTAVERLARLPMKPEAAAIVEAMAAGERRGITPELRARYSRSGLRTCWPCRTSHGGSSSYSSTPCCGGCRCCAGGTPAEKTCWQPGPCGSSSRRRDSAERRAGRRDVHRLAGGTGLGLEYVGMNALATAAFGMLLWNPNWLGTSLSSSRSSPWRAFSRGACRSAAVAGPGGKG